MDQRLWEFTEQTWWFLNAATATGKTETAKRAVRWGCGEIRTPIFLELIYVFTQNPLDARPHFRVN